MRKQHLRIALPFAISIALVFALALMRGHSRFDETLFSMDRVLEMTQHLSQPELKGRGLEGEGHKLTASYLENYFKTEKLTYQTLSTQILLPHWDTHSYIRLASGETFEVYKDFRPDADYYGTSMDYSGDLIYLGSDYYEVSPQLLKDKIIIIKTINLTQDQIEYVRSSGAKGILYQTTGPVYSGYVPPKTLDQKSYDLRHKLGADFFCAEISAGFAEKLRTYSGNTALPGYKNTQASGLTGQFEDQYFGIIPKVTLHAPLNYETVTALNYIVTLPGKDPLKATNWVTHYDGNGLSASGKVYPGVSDGGASTAMLLELARTASLQNNIPDHDLNFVFLSGLSVSDQSSKITADYFNSRYDHNANWIVEALGVKESEGTVLGYNTYNDFDRMLVHQLYNNLDRFPAPLIPKGETVYPHFNRYGFFKTAENAYITLSSLATAHSGESLGSLHDDLSNLDAQSLESVSQVFLGHMNLQIYKEHDYAFIKNEHLIVLFILLLLIHFSVAPRKMIEAEVAPLWIHRLNEQVIYKLLSKFIQNALPFLISLLVVNLILSIPPDANMRAVGTSYVTNFSLYETLRQSYAGMLMFLNSLTFTDMGIYKEIGLYLKRSLILVFWGLGISITLGLLKGLMDAYFNRKSGSLSTFISIVLYSIPDVLVAFVSMVAVVVLSKHPLTASWIDPEFLRIYFMPLLALTIIPIIYIARVVFVALEDEKQKDYVKFLRYKGFNTRRIYLYHFSRVGFVKILEVSKTIIMLIFSNLIVVEYLFNYPGIMFNLLSDSTEPTMIISMSLSIGLSFALLYLVTVLVLKIMEPGRRRS